MWYSVYLHPLGINFVGIAGEFISRSAKYCNYYYYYYKFIACKELIEVFYIQSVEHKLIASITDMCHQPLLTCALYFSTHNFRIISNHPFVVAAKPKNGHFAVLQVAVLHSVQNDINGS
jgi:hypothetical protein